MEDSSTDRKLTKTRKRKKCSPATCGKSCKNCRYKKQPQEIISDCCRLAKLLVNDEQATDDNKEAGKQ